MVASYSGEDPVYSGERGASPGGDGGGNGGEELEWKYPGEPGYSGESGIGGVVEPGRIDGDVGWNGGEELSYSAISSRRSRDSLLGSNELGTYDGDVGSISREFSDATW